MKSQVHKKPHSNKGGAFSLYEVFYFSLVIDEPL